MKYSYLVVLYAEICLTDFNQIQTTIQAKELSQLAADLCLMRVHDLLLRRLQEAVSLLPVELQFVIRQKFMKNFGEIYSWLSEGGIW